MSNTVLVTMDGPLRVITLNRPDKLNAFNEEMHLAFRAALQSARDDDTCRAVLLTGAGRGFCAGQDLGDRDPSRGEVPNLGETLRNFFNPNIRLIRDMPKPVIAAVNGAAAGAGANIALACDVVLAARSAKFLQAFARIGLIPDAGGSWALTRLVGPARARALAMLAEPLPAETAADWGLIWKAVDDDRLMAAALDMAGKLANGPTTGLALTKQAILAAATNTLEEQLELEAELQARAGASDDYQEGVTAFLEKRPPRFTGR
ncbi:MAG: 2-(1,2-epoxy-1,2-dihydrophenyl)acetyl-CoA isomerase PaaG [Pseudomonadota bacterium]|nr:2-(1,2-epoxy-1,2-dihydrophenyl)acetyl-CoA isomerase PaaG [Pseudomonadota bacterium]